ncbi:MAG: TonB-dependent receptor [Candidatus Azotimanducaceae bacterium WSBS_2022_MAG_OTU7]
MKISINKKICLMGMALSIGSAPLHSAVLEEVVVTAQKREQSMQDVGVAVSAFTGDQMNQLGWDTADDVVAQAPGVTLVQPNGPGSFYINIRGVAQNDFSGDNQESPVAIYVDDVYVASPTGAGFQLFDFERVEIVRGPQGTLFGRNATGGLVHYLTKRPTQETEGYIKGTFGEFSQVDVEGAIGGGLTDMVSGRLSFNSSSHDPIIKNNTGSDLSDNDVWAARGQLLFEFGESAELLLNVRAAELDNTNAPFDHRSSRLDADGLGEFFDGVDLSDFGGFNGTGGYRDPDGGRIHQGEYDAEGFVKIETQGYTATFKMEVGDGMEFVSITDYNELERDYLEDSDASPTPFFHFALKSDMEQFSQEFRLSGLTENMSWVAGAYYMSYEGDLFSGGVAGGFAREAFQDTTVPDEFGFNSPFSTETESTAFFGQVEFDLSDTLTLTAGLRWSKEEKSTQFDQYYSLFQSTTSNDVAVQDLFELGDPVWTYGGGQYSNRGSVTLFGAFGINLALLEGQTDTEIDDDFFTWKLGLDWSASEDTLVYVSYNRGIKAGGFNAPLDATLFINDSLTREEFAFDKETLDAYEIGFKMDLWDGRARLNGAAYYYDYQDYQAFNLESLTLFVFNTDAVNKGFELELQASPAEGWDVLLGIAYTDTNVEDAFTTLGGDVLDREMIMTPEFSFNGMFRYEWTMGGGMLAAQYDFNYLGDHFFQLKNSPVVEESAYVISNVRLTYTPADADWTLSIFVNNATDEEYRQMALDLSGDPLGGGFGMTESAYGKPRWVGISFNYNL